MKVKITYPDGTVVEYEYVAASPSLPVHIPVTCTCGKAWLGITPPPPCPWHGGMQGPAPWTQPYAVGVSTNGTATLTLSGNLAGCAVVNGPPTC